jgi:hypothetical protein
MNREELDNICFNIAADLFEKEILVRPDTRTEYFLKFAVLLFELKKYYKRENRDERDAILKKLDERIKESEILDIQNNKMVSYLEAAFLHISRTNCNLQIEREAWNNIEINENSIHVPGMIDLETMKYYKWLGKNLSGIGDIVELGSWMGRSTCSIGEGLHSNRSFINRKLHVFDSFVWDTWMIKFMDRKLQNSYGLKVGESFLRIFLLNVSPFIRFIEPHVCVIFQPSEIHDFRKNNSHNIPHIAWYGAPIELLIYDMGPDIDKINAVWEVFQPYFISGKTIVVFQEYGKLRSENIRQFCSYHSNQLQPIHKLDNSVKGYHYIGAVVEN